MKKIFNIIMTTYAGAVFMFWVFIAYLVSLYYLIRYKNTKDKEYLTFLYKTIGPLITNGIFLKINKHHHYSYAENETYIVVSNHQTIIDIPSNVVGAPDNILFKFLGKKEANKIPFFGGIINRFCVLVDRKNPESRHESYSKMKAEMQKGYSIFLYPEGTRNRTKEPLKDFYNGAFKLAIEMQKPIVVNTLVNIKKLNPPKGFFTYTPGTIDTHWDAPISTKGMTIENDLEKLKKTVAEVMIDRLKNN